MSTSFKHQCLPILRLQRPMVEQLQRRTLYYQPRQEAQPSSSASKSVLALCLSSSIKSSFATFLPKYSESQHSSKSTQSPCCSLHGKVYELQFSDRRTPPTTVHLKARGTECRTVTWMSEQLLGERKQSSTLHISRSASESSSQSSSPRCTTVG